MKWILAKEKAAQIVFLPTFWAVKLNIFKIWWVD